MRYYNILWYLNNNYHYKHNRMRNWRTVRNLKMPFLSELGWTERISPRNIATPNNTIHSNNIHTCLWTSIELCIINSKRSHMKKYEKCGYASLVPHMKKLSLLFTFSLLSYTVCFSFFSIIWSLQFLLYLD